MLFKALEDFGKVSGIKLNLRKTEAMWAGSLQNCEDESLGVKMGKMITYADVMLLVIKILDIDQRK